MCRRREDDFHGTVADLKARRSKGCDYGDEGKASATTDWQQTVPTCSGGDGGGFAIGTSVNARRNEEEQVP